MSNEKLYWDDGGYGVTMNKTMRKILNNIPKKRQKEYLKKLEKQDKEKYSEFMEWYR